MASANCLIFVCNSLTASAMNFEFFWLCVSNVFISSVDCQNLLFSSHLNPKLNPKGMGSWTMSGVPPNRTENVGEHTWVPPCRSLSMRTLSNSWHVPTCTCSVSLILPALSSDIPWHPRVVPTPQRSSNLSLHGDHPACLCILNPSDCQQPAGMEEDGWLLASVSALFWLHTWEWSFFSFLCQYGSFLSLRRLVFWSNHIPTESGKICSERFCDP